MKKNSRFIIGSLNAWGIICLCIVFICVIVSSFVMQEVTVSSSNNDTPSIGYTVVVDPGHGGLDVK